MTGEEHTDGSSLPRSCAHAVLRESEKMLKDTELEESRGQGAVQTCKHAPLILAGLPSK